MKKTVLLSVLIALAGCHRAAGGDAHADDPYRSSFSMNESTRNDMGRPPQGPLSAPQHGEMSQATPGPMGGR